MKITEGRDQHMPGHKDTHHTCIKEQTTQGHTAHIDMSKLHKKVGIKNHKGLTKTHMADDDSVFLLLCFCLLPSRNGADITDSKRNHQ